MSTYTSTGEHHVMSQSGLDPGSGRSSDFPNSLRRRKDALTTQDYRSTMQHPISCSCCAVMKERSIFSSYSNSSERSVPSRPKSLKRHLESGRIAGPSRTSSSVCSCKNSKASTIWHSTKHGPTKQMESQTPASAVG